MSFKPNFIIIVAIYLTLYVRTYIEPYCFVLMKIECVASKCSLVFLGNFP